MVSNWHASPPLRRETAATGPSFLAAATTSGWPHCLLQDIQGPFWYWSELVFLRPARRGLRGHPLQGTPRCEPPPKERVGIFGEGCEIKLLIWSKLQYFQETVGGSLDRSLSPSPPLTEYSSPLFPYTPFPPAHPPLTVIMSICNPTPCFIYVVSSGPLWPTFCHFKS